MFGDLILNHSNIGFCGFVFLSPSYKVPIHMTVFWGSTVIIMIAVSITYSGWRMTFLDILINGSSQYRHEQMIFQILIGGKWCSQRKQGTAWEWQVCSKCNVLDLTIIWVLQCFHLRNWSLNCWVCLDPSSSWVQDSTRTLWKSTFPSRELEVEEMTIPQQISSCKMSKPSELESHWRSGTAATLRNALWSTTLMNLVSHSQKEEHCVHAITDFIVKLAWLLYINQ